MYVKLFEFMEKLAENFSFSGMTNREHAIFEVGIKLAALFHQLVGAPIKNDEEVMRKIADGLKESISCQPYVKRVDVKILKDTQAFKKVTEAYSKKHEFDYTYIQGRNLVAEVEVQYEDWIAIGKVEWISDLNYPLMYVREVKQV